MNASRFDRLVRALTDGATPRRVVLRGLAGAGFAAALLPWIGVRPEEERLEENTAAQPALLAA